MLSSEILSGHIYAVTTKPFWFEPYVAVETKVGLRMLPAEMYLSDISSDGPHDISEDVMHSAITSGMVFEDEDIFSLWSERLLAEHLTKIDLDGSIWEETVNTAIQEAVLIANSDTPSEELSKWLRSNSDWQGSSASVLYDGIGNMSGAFVTLFTGNPYRLMVLLKWLQVPDHIIQNVTGIESY
jgi:hypothetical protein